MSTGYDTLNVLDHISPFLRGLIQQLRDRRGVHQAMADGARAVVQAHFVKNTQDKKNPYGVRASFWPRMRKATFARATESEGQVVMPREVRQRFLGGVIRPVKAGALTIPVNKAAYGKRAGEFQDLAFVKMPLGSKVVALLIKRGAPGAGRRKGIAAEIMFILVKSVTQKGDATVLPTVEELYTGVTKAVTTFFRPKPTPGGAVA